MKVIDIAEWQYRNIAFSPIMPSATNAKDVYDMMLKYAKGIGIVNVQLHKLIDMK